MKRKVRHQNCRFVKVAHVRQGLFSKCVEEEFVCVNLDLARELKELELICQTFAICIAEKMSSMNLLSTTADGQQVFLTSAGQHILTTTTDPNIIFSENPNKTIVLHDPGVVDNVDQATGVEYTLIEDQSGGGLLQIAAANAGGQSSGAGNIVLSQDFFDVIDNVDLQHSFQNEVIEKKVAKKDVKLEKPIGNQNYKQYN